MSSIAQFMLAGHQDCDDLFARAEGAAGEWPAAADAVAAFRQALEHHLTMEEAVLFPAFEDETGMSGGGPTQAMRAEHMQMRSLLQEMVDAAAARDEGGYLGAADTLLVLMQQHNVKEESMMYPMIDQALPAQVDDLIARCEALEPATA